jgi:hypothetical protein
VTLPKLGMVVSLPLLIFVGSLASGEFHWKEVLINCVVLTIGSLAGLHQGPVADHPAVARIHVPPDREPHPWTAQQPASSVFGVAFTFQNLLYAFGGACWAR